MNYNGARPDFEEDFGPEKPYIPVVHNLKREMIAVGDTVGYLNSNRKRQYGKVLNIFGGKAVVEIFGRGTHIAYISELTKYAVG